jgi:anti-anti-sigma factor
MKIEILRADDLVTVAALIGRLDLNGEREIVKAFKSDVIDRGRPVVIDLSGVVFMSSVGIEMLILAAKELEEKGVRMAIAAPAAMVEKILRRTGVEEVIPIAPDTETAMTLLGLAQSTPA